MKAVHLRRDAELDVTEAALWYEGERPGLGDDFEAEIHATLDRIRENPRQFPVLKEQVRRALVDRFPYGAYFVEFDDISVVIAVLHLHRHPDTWQQRNAG